MLIWRKKFKCVFFPTIQSIQRKCQINLFSCIFELNSKNSNLDWKRRILETYESKFHRTFLAVKWDFPPVAQTSYIYFKRISKRTDFHITTLVEPLLEERRKWWKILFCSDTFSRSYLHLALSFGWSSLISSSLARVSKVWGCFLLGLCLCLCVLVCWVLSSHHSDQMSRGSQVSIIALW